jgi:hypothetical protein
VFATGQERLVVHADGQVLFERQPSPAQSRQEPHQEEPGPAGPLARYGYLA